jgi:hypothetical protein
VLRKADRNDLARSRQPTPILDLWENAGEKIYADEGLVGPDGSRTLIEQLFQAGDGA